MGTTLGLQWFTSPYVHELQRVSRGSGSNSSSGDNSSDISSSGGSGDDVLRARTLTLLGRPRWTEFRLSEVEYPDTLRPLATFKVRLCSACWMLALLSGRATCSSGGAPPPSLTTP